MNFKELFISFLIWKLYLHKHTLEILQIWFQIPTIKQVIIFLLVEGLAFNLTFLKKEEQNQKVPYLWSAIKQGVPVPDIPKASP